MAEAYEAFHLDHDDALTLASWSDDTMATCILDLYRSATPNVYDSWGDQFGPTSAPGLILFAELDSFGNEAMSTEIAETFGAREATLSGVGHWWALERPARSGRRHQGVHPLGRLGPESRRSSVDATHEDEGDRQRDHRDRE